MTTPDKLIERFGLPAFIKIDVEGFETEVLRGLSHPVKMISCEYTVPEQAGKTIDCVESIERNSPQVLCNYSIGESMEFALKDWIPASELKKHLLTREFNATGFGDIYIQWNP